MPFERRPSNTRCVAVTFDRLARRFGMTRAVVLVKQRAARRAEQLRATPIEAEPVTT